MDSISERLQQTEKRELARARALLNEGRNSEAEEAARSAARTFEQEEGQSALLAEALTVRGAALARLERHGEARAVLERAAEAAGRAGDSEGAGRAVLTLMEELGRELTNDALRLAYSRADRLLAYSEDAETLARLRRCARLVIKGRRPTRAAKEATNFIYGALETATLLRQARLIAATETPVLLTGETGTGKEVLARLMHEWSGRTGHFLAVNCAALTDARIESQLFGHREGSFAGAIENHPGAVREASGGTLLLDEVGALSKHAQGKLLRLIECSEIHPVGAIAPEYVNVRVIAVTNCDLRELVAEGRFREDLLYRLQTFHLDIPPLRERVADIPIIAAYLIEQASRSHDKRLKFTPASMEAMRRLPLQGNVRELSALIARVFLQASDGWEISAETIETIAFRETKKVAAAEEWEGCSLVEEVLQYEKTLLRRALDEAQGGVTRAAYLLGMTHQALIATLNTRHQDLLVARRPAQRRRRSIIRIKR